MWLSGQQKQPPDRGEGQTGIVTIGGKRPAVRLDGERRELKVYSPDGVRWTPRAGQRVLVIKCQDETPCIVGAEETEEKPELLELAADNIDLQGHILINGVPIEVFVLALLGGG